MHTDKKSLWVRCPHCYAKTRIKVYEETIMLNFPLFCRRCQKETVVNIVKLKMVISDEPDA